MIQVTHMKLYDGDEYIAKQSTKELFGTEDMDEIFEIIENGKRVYQMTELLSENGMADKLLDVMGGLNDLVNIDRK